MTWSPSVHRRQRHEARSRFFGFRGPEPGSDATNAPGPGVYLYLLPMGAGQSKGDNSHHWGFPFHSCYGTAVESFAKLADSIYFKSYPDAGSSSRDGGRGGLARQLQVASGSHQQQQHVQAVGSQGTQGLDTTESSREQEGGVQGDGPGRRGAPPSPAPTGECPHLYVNQYVSSTLKWREEGVELSMEADYYATGSSAWAELLITSAPPAGACFTLMLRIPVWAARDSARIRLNGCPQEWTDCPGIPASGTYCQLKRQWRAGDMVHLALVMQWHMKPLPDTRPQFAGLHALMHGPFVMAGLTHDSRVLEVDTEPLDRLIYQPPDADELMSVQAAWDSSLYIRHDMHQLHISAMEDNGDNIDATFRFISGCHASLMLTPSNSSDAAHGTGAAGSSSASGSGSSDSGSGGPGSASPRQRQALEGLKTLMRLGLPEQGVAVTLESMNFPGFYVSYDLDGNMVLQQPDGSSSFCDSATFLLRPGLAGEDGTISFEAAAMPGYYLSAFLSLQAPCKDYLPDCHERAAAGECKGASPGLAEVRCRASCQRCGAARGALRLLKLVPGSVGFAQASSWKLTTPLTPRYPPGSRVVVGRNRQYLLVPLGNIVDERYTVYFDVRGPWQHRVQGHDGVVREELEL